MNFNVRILYFHIINPDSTVSKCPGSLPSAPPTYLVSVDSLKADSRPYKYLVAQTVEQRWQKYFSASLVVSSSILADLNSDEPCLHGPETRIEVHGVWNRQSSYFHGKNVKEVSPHAHLIYTLILIVSSFLHYFCTLAICFVIEANGNIVSCYH